MKTQTIAGHTVTLTPGRRYLASRPMASRKRTSYPITIRDITEDFLGPDSCTIPDLDYDAANAFLLEFNNGTTSWDGRAW